MKKTSPRQSALPSRTIAGLATVGAARAAGGASNAKLTDRAIRILRELCPQLDRSAAADLLEAADGQLKVAIVMECIGIDAPEARKRIDACNGRLRPILEA